MHRIVAFIAVTLLSLATVALAEEIEGTVKSVDASDRVITLDDGTRVSIPDNMTLGQFREGVEVLISYEEKDGKYEAKTVEVK